MFSGKTHYSNGQSMAILHSYVTNYQMVNPIKSHWTPLNHHFPIIFLLFSFVFSIVFLGFHLRFHEFCIFLLSSSRHVAPEVSCRPNALICFAPALQGPRKHVGSGRAWSQRAGRRVGSKVSKVKSWRMVTQWATGWWFGTWLLFFHILGMSSSQWTNSYFSGGRYTTNQIMDHDGEWPDDYTLYGHYLHIWRITWWRWSLWS